MTTQAEFFQQHAVDGVLPEAKMVELLAMEPDKGDSGTPPQSDEPIVDAEPKASSTTEASTEASQVEVKEGATEPLKEPVPEPTEAELNATNAVIQAKDGIHTISYDRLTEARQRAADAEARAVAEAAKTATIAAELEALKKGQQAAAATVGTQVTESSEADQAALLEGVDFGDYGDAAMAKAVAQIATRAAAAAIAKMPQPQATATETVDPNKAHMDAIYTAHKDADSIPDSREFNAWLDSQPKVAAAAYRHALQAGTTEEVIETFTAYKAATGRTSAAPTTEQSGADAAAAAQAAVANAKSKAPTSLSEIPSGTAAAHNEADALMTKSASQQLSTFMGKTPEQIEQLLARVL